MQTETLLYIILAGIIALFLALFQYWFFVKQKGKQQLIYTFLRFISLFSLLLLLINLKFEQVSYYNEKPNLVVAIDNSESVSYLGQDKNAQQLLETLKENQELQERFNMEYYTFGNTLKVSDSASFSEKQTNISAAFSELAQVYKNTNAPTLLITDGNQTYGTDYEFSFSNYKQPIFPVILGDTITYSDLRVQQLNVNRYAFLKNRFPIEVILTYKGNTKVNTRFVVKSGSNTIYSKSVSFSKEKSSQILNFTLPANSVGVRTYSAQILPLEAERNKVNNTKAFAVEVIDQKTNVAIVSSIVHPDLGTLKKAIESNEQRSVEFLKPNFNLNKLDDYQLVIVYQPNATFKALYDALNTSNKNHFTITGPKTDWNFMSNTIPYLDKDRTNQTEDYQPVLNTSYNTFIVDNIRFESFPPLKSSFGEIVFSSPVQAILFKKLGSTETEQPLLATIENGQRREAYLFGEGIWRWRAQSYLNTKSFEEFDNFVGKIVQYLASNKHRNRLNVDYESFYDGSSPVRVSAQFFDKNYTFDNRGTLNIIVKNRETNDTLTIPFVLNNNNYEVDLSSLPAGEYNFTVLVKDEGLQQSGSFTILDFDVEQQFLNADVTKLQRLATNSNGKAYFINETDDLISDLLNDNRFAIVQKSNRNIVPLIDWKYLLALIALSLAIEWFMRKYNGLI